MVEQLAKFITESISQLGYGAIFLLMTLESALIPIPSEVTMPFAGFLVGLGKLNFWLAVIVGALGNLTGSLLAYGLGFWGQKNLVHKLVRSYGKYLLITVDEVEQSEKWFRTHGGKIAFFSRLLPVVRTFISLPAGMSKMSLVTFSVYTFIGSFLWSAVLAKLGMILGKNWHSLEGYFRQFQILIVVASVALVVLYVRHKVKKIKRSTYDKG